jgi:LytS/YehU family sensor histidine kinase
VTGHCTDDTLVVEVANTGHWREERPRPAGTDTGLDNVRTRLQTQYPDHNEFTLTEDDGWVRARIEIPTAAFDRHA